MAVSFSGYSASNFAGSAYTVSVSPISYFLNNDHYGTVANCGDEFLEAAFITDKSGGSAVLFDAQVVEKGW
jgi:hypothetical protein